MKEITIRKRAVQIMESHYGEISYGEWCRKEAARLNRGMKSFKHTVHAFKDRTICIVRREKGTNGKLELPPVSEV